MSRSGTRSETRISGQTIIDELVRNMELGRLEMAYSVLLPCIFSVYLHPDDYARLAGVGDLIKEDARKALATRALAEWNRKGGLLPARRGARTGSRIAQNDFWIEWFADSEGSVPARRRRDPLGIERCPMQPGYRGAKTTLIDREPSVTSARVAPRPRRHTA